MKHPSCEFSHAVPGDALGYSDDFLAERCYFLAKRRFSGFNVHPTPPHIEQSFTKLDAYNTEKAAQVKAARKNSEQQPDSRKAG